MKRREDNTSEAWDLPICRRCSLPPPPACEQARQFQSSEWSDRLGYVVVSTWHRLLQHGCNAIIRRRDPAPRLHQHEHEDQQPARAGHHEQWSETVGVVRVTVSHDVDNFWTPCRVQPPLKEAGSTRDKDSSRPKGCTSPATRRSESSLRQSLGAQSWPASIRSRYPRNKPRDEPRDPGLFPILEKTLAHWILLISLRKRSLDLSKRPTSTLNHYSHLQIKNICLTFYYFLYIIRFIAN